MRYIHNARIRVFLKPEEYIGKDNIIEKCKDVFKKIIPLDFEKEKLSINEEVVESFESRKIRIFSIEIIKEAHTNLFLKNLNQMLGEEQRKKLLEQRWSRLDDDSFFLHQTR